MATTRHMTAEEFIQLPDDGRVLELIDGIVVEVEPPPGRQHEYVIARVVRLLGNHVEQHELGVVLGAPGFVLARGPDEVRAPDVSFLTGQSAVHAPHTPGYGSGAPALVVEVLSPSNAVRQLEDKCRRWIEAGAGAALLLAPMPRTATVFRSAGEPSRLTAEDVVNLGDIVTGWRPRVADLLG